MPSFIGSGSSDASSANVTNPSVLTPGLPGTRTNGDRLICFSVSTSATATVAISSGWQTVWNVLTAGGRLVGFSALVTGGESAPTVTWSGLTTGSSGTPCIAQIANIGTGLLESGGQLVVDTTSGTSSANDASSQASGAAFYTVGADTWIFAESVRSDDSFLTSLVDAGGVPVSWIFVLAQQTTSGAGLTMFVSMGGGPAPVGGLVTEHTLAITGAPAALSNGVMVAVSMPAVPGEAGTYVYTRGRAPG